MKKLIVLSAVVALQSCAYARTMSEKALASTGGLLIREGSQQGEIVIKNCQSAAKTEWISEVAGTLSDSSRLKVVLKEGEFKLENPSLDGAATIFIIADDVLPMSLVAAEAKWAVVNVRKISSDKEAFFAARVKKLTARTFALLCGGANSKYHDSLLGPVSSPQDLDTHMSWKLPMDVVMRIVSTMSKCGVTPAVYSTYIKACEQGWAPAPTNEYQKAIWDKIHSAPANPMKIEFDPKKGR